MDSCIKHLNSLSFLSAKGCSQSSHLAVLPGILIGIWMCCNTSHWKNSPPGKKVLHGRPQKAFSLKRKELTKIFKTMTSLINFRQPIFYEIRKVRIFSHQ